MSQTIPITKNYKVLVGCMTFNHSKYIVDALNGFAMQQTDFPFVCIVMDDASTDGEQEVIKEWLQKESDIERADFYDLELASVILVPHKTNTNCTFAIYLLKRNLYKEENLKFDLVKDWGGHCEYIALCEGDDYWTDPEKLQIQSNCLDTHPEVDMCAHSYIEKHAISGKEIRKRCRKKVNGIIPAEDVILGGGDYFATNSLLFRKEIEFSIPKFKEFMSFDYTHYIHGALRGGIYYVERIMSVYRRNVPNSWSATFSIDKEYQIAFNSMLIEMLDILDEEYEYKYHQAIRTQKFKYSVAYANTPFQNIHQILNNFDVFKLLPFKQKFLILLKGLCPKLSLLMKRALIR